MEFNTDSVMKDLIFLRAQGNQMNYHYPDILGYFDYKNHSFIIRSDSIYTTIFKKSNNNRDFDFSFPPAKYTIEGIPILGQFDIFAVWSIRFKQENFKILSFFTNDKNDDWFNYIEQEYNEIE